MKVKVTENGLVIPKEFLDGVDEVEIRKTDNLVVIVPTTRGDPILDLGQNPVECGVPDASERHDQYLYGSNS
jgi:virulence-associated protein VagC